MNSSQEIKGKPALKTGNKEDPGDQAKRKSVMWDWKTLEEQELEKKLNPKIKIDEPKTPYIPYEVGDDEYLQKLNEINKTQPTV